VYPAITQQLDYEAELAFVIGRRCKDVAPRDAFKYIAGYTIFNDVTARDVQLGDRQWVRGKTPDNLTPVGPHLVTADEIPDPCDLGIRLWLNGQLMQDSRTNQFIWDIPYLVNFLSTSFTLEPGDIVATGTPGGVGFVRQPPVFMHPGDRVRVEVEGLGALENEVIA
jgi:acylpyruvate hydrolase